MVAMLLPCRQSASWTPTQMNGCATPLMIALSNGKLGIHTAMCSYVKTVRTASQLAYESCVLHLCRVISHNKRSICPNLVIPHLCCWLQGFCFVTDTSLLCVSHNSTCTFSVCSADSHCRSVNKPWCQELHSNTQQSSIVQYSTCCSTCTLSTIYSITAGGLEMQQRMAKWAQSLLGSRYRLLMVAVLLTTMACMPS